MVSQSNKTAIRFLPVVIIFLLTVIFFSSVIFQGKTFFAFDNLFNYLPWSSFAPDFHSNNALITDPVNMHYLWHRLIVASIKLKTFPLWNGSLFGGIPFATGYTSHMNPIAFIAYLLMPLTVAHDVVLGLHLMASGIFMFLYLRSIDLRVLPSLIGAVAWMFNGYVMVFFEIESAVITASALPASLYFIERWLKKRSLLHCLLFALAVSVSVGSGYTHLIIFQSLFVIIYLIYRIIFFSRSHGIGKTFQKKDIRYLLIAAIFIGILSANFITSHLIFLEDPQRTNISFDTLFQQTGQLPFKYLITLLFPDFFGSPAGQLFSFTPRLAGSQPYNNYSELCIYVGVLTLFLSVGTLPYIFRQRHVAFFLLTSLLALTMAMGSIFYWPFAKFIPGLGFSSPTRILYLFGFAISTLCAIGAHIISDTQVTKKISLIIIWIVLSGTAITVATLVQTEIGRDWVSNVVHGVESNLLSQILSSQFSFISHVILHPVSYVAATQLALCAALMSKRSRSKTLLLSAGLLILSLDLLTFSWKYNTRSPRYLAYPKTEAIEFLRKDTSLYRVMSLGPFFHNSFEAYDISDIGGYHSFYPRRYAEYLHLSQYGLDVPLPSNYNRWINFKKFGSPLFDLINTKYLLLPPSAKVNMPKLELVYNKEIKIFKNKDAFPRFFFVKDFKFCKSREEAYKTLGSFTQQDFKQRVILESLPAEPMSMQKRAPKTEPDTSIKLISYHQNRIDFSVSTNQRGFIVLSDSYNTDWKATVDKKQADVLRANYIMRAIPISAGTHRIELTFQPKSLILGFVITIAGWIGIFLLIIICLFKERKFCYSK